MRIVKALLFVIWLVQCNSPLQAEFRVGAAKEVITPDPLLPISGGMGPTAPASKKHGELTARAVVLEQGDVRVAVVSIDALGFPGVLSDRVRRLVSGIPAENILIGATHNHSGPDFYAFPDGKGGHTGDLNYIDSVCRKAAKAINQAVESLHPATLKAATGKSGRQDRLQLLRSRPLRSPRERLAVRQSQRRHNRHIGELCRAS